jgi:hypothetical protein
LAQLFRQLNRRFAVGFRRFADNCTTAKNKFFVVQLNKAMFALLDTQRMMPCMKIEYPHKAKNWNKRNTR